MQKRKKAGINLAGTKGRVTQIYHTAEQAKIMDACQAIINASNPEEGDLSKTDVMHLAMKLLYKKLRSAHAGVRKSVKEVRDQTGDGKVKNRGNGQDQPSAPQDGEPCLDLDALDEAVKEAKANHKKAQAR